MAIDSNIVDLLGVMAVPADPHMRRELFACYWLRSLGFVWRSTLYAFSDKLYAEVAGPAARLLFLFDGWRRRFGTISGHVASHLARMGPTDGWECRLPANSPVPGLPLCGS